MKAIRKRRGTTTVVPRMQLVDAIQRIVRHKELSQTATGAIVQEAPSQISLLMSGRIAGFSTDRLMRILLRLGNDIEITIRNRGRNSRAGRVVVRTGGRRAAVGS